MTKVLSVDAGRQFVKVVSDGKKKIFQSVMAEAPEKFNLEIKDNADDLFINHGGQNYLIGDLALRQSTSATQDRSANKGNKQNIILTIVACSLFVDPGEKITLLTNCPARDWGRQRDKIKGMLEGYHRIDHKAGKHKGRAIDFTIKQAHVFPEGEAAYWGYIYDRFLNVEQPDLLKANVLVLDIGDQTCNYISMNPGGEPFDALSGSLDLGIFRAYAGLQGELESLGLEANQGEIADALINGRNLHIGQHPVYVSTEIQPFYKRLAGDIYNRLHSRLNFTRYQFILLTGGGGQVLARYLKDQLGAICEVRSSPKGQWLNALGAEVIYNLSKRS